MRDIIDYRPIPSGMIATAYANPLARNNSYPVCEHGGWFECQMQAYQLCFGRSTANVWQQKQLVDCHLANYLNGTVDPLEACAAQLELPHSELQACARNDSTATPLLQASFLKGVTRGIIGTPTVYINGNLSFWSNESMLAAQICNAYKGVKPKGCPGETQYDQQAIPVSHTSMCSLLQQH